MNTQEFPDHIMSMDELKEYFKLRNEIIGSNSFVEVNFSNPDHIRLNVLAMKYMNLRKHVAKSLTQFRDAVIPKMPKG